MNASDRSNREWDKRMGVGTLIACSKRSDSGERCGVEKAMKSRGGLGREVRFPLSPLLLPRFYFFALPFTLHRSPLSERLEQARTLKVKGWLVSS